MAFTVCSIQHSITTALTHVAVTVVTALGRWVAKLDEILLDVICCGGIGGSVVVVEVWEHGTDSKHRACLETAFVAVADDIGDGFFVGNGYMDEAALTVDFHVCFRFWKIGQRS